MSNVNTNNINNSDMIVNNKINIIKEAKLCCFDNINKHKNYNFIFLPLKIQSYHRIDMFTSISSEI